MIDDALKHLYKKLGCDDFGADVEIVLVTAEAAQDYFNANFQWQPWLAIPFTHTQKRQQVSAVPAMN